MYKGARGRRGRIGKLSEKLARSRRCKGGAVSLKDPQKGSGHWRISGKAEDRAEIPKSEDLPCTGNLHRLRTMASCKNRLAHSSSILFAIPLVLLVACGNHPSGFFIVQGALFPIKKSRKNILQRENHILLR